MVEIKLRINELLKEKGMSQKELAEKTGIRPAAISEICNNQRKSINKEHLAKIIETLNISDSNEIFVLENAKQ
ncbi:helix-turn-helix domain-containing protein [Bacillus massilinigeriensis]|uniref:helix-turn-helix domain-containing protein n=1 Tax=Bacillus mediterraneensis TaxID=1805474 RepID=UPI0008F87E7A|nr:helix-turn-helix transcriptional regulator [Bacillus mediterraneensis]